MYQILKFFFSIIFLISIFLTITHHHTDLKVHNDCKICILQSNILNVDTFAKTNYLSYIVVISEAILFTPIIIDNQKIKNQLHSRAPPFFS